jgi:hypothetical protein
MGSNSVYAIAANFSPVMGVPVSDPARFSNPL